MYDHIQYAMQRRKISEVEVKFIWKCSFCDCKHEEMSFGEMVCIPFEPYAQGWRYLGDKGWACPRHEVKFDVSNITVSEIL